MKKILLMVMVLVNLSAVQLFAQTLLGSDNAGNYSNWTNGSNLGSYLTAWDLWTTGSGNVGFYLGDAVDQGFGDINTSSKGFAMYANSSTVNDVPATYAQRFISGTGSPETSSRAYLLPGMSLKISVAVAYRNGQKGIRFKGQNFEDLFLFDVTSDQYRVNETNLGWTYSQASIFIITIEQVNTSQYRVNIVRGTDEYNSENINGVVSGFLAFITDTDTGSDLNNLFLNSIEIYHGTSVNTSLSIQGSAGWRMMSSPVSGATYADLLGPIWTQGITGSDSPTFGTANVLTHNGSTFEAVADLNNTMSPGQGFIVYVYQDDNYTDAGDGSFPKTLTLDGTENTGPVSPTLTSGASAGTLVGNPYAATIDADDVFTASSNLSGVVYVYDHSYTATSGDDASNATGGAFRAWNGSAGGLTDGLIAPFQGFWVQNAASGTPSLTIPTSAKSTGGTFYKTATVASIELAAKMGSLYSSAYFSFTELASEGMDNRDAFKLTPLDFKNYLSLSSKVEGNSIDINNLPAELSSQIRIPLNIDAFEADLDGGNWKMMDGVVTLSWPAISNIPSGWVLQLEDNQTGAIVNLLEETEYTFTLDAPVAKVAYDAKNLGPKQVTAVNSSRFSVVVGPITTSVRELSEVPNVVVLHQNYPNPFNPSTQIAFELPQAMNVSVTVFDMLGREVAMLLNGSSKAGFNTVTWNASNVGSGIYYYRLVAGENTITKKMTLVK